MAAPGAVVLTIGHSNHDLDHFVALLMGAGATVLVDVRSVPASRWLPHFNGKALECALAATGIGYAWLGAALGGRPADPALVVDGVPDYEAMARQPAFAAGIEQVATMATAGTPALMCAERAPLDCHRALLVAPALAARGLAVRHVLADGTVEDHTETERRMMTARGAGELFGADPAAAYRHQARRAALKRRR